MRDDNEAAMVLDVKRRCREEFAQARSRPRTPVFLYDETRPSWKAAMPMYVMYCDSCDRYTVTYPAGYYAKIRCDGCRGFAIVREHALEHPTSALELLWYAVTLRVQQKLRGMRTALGLDDDPRLPPPKE